MTYYDHATLIALNLSPWARFDEAREPRASHQIEAARAEERHAPAEFSKDRDVTATLQRLLGR